MNEFARSDMTDYRTSDKHNFVEALKTYQSYTLNHTNYAIRQSLRMQKIDTDKNYTFYDTKYNTREEKIISLKDTLQSGTYRVKYEKIAEKIILDHLLYSIGAF